MFREFADICELLGKYSERNRKISILADKLKGLGREEVRVFSHLIIGRIFPDWQQRTLEISWATIAHIIIDMFKVDRSELVRAIKATGDVGSAVEYIASKRKIKRQLTLVSFEREVSILDVYDTLNRISEISGVDARSRKELLLSSLISRLSPRELKILIRIIFGDMRHGVNIGILEEAISKASGIPVEHIIRAYMLLGDIGEVAEISLFDGYKKLKDVKIRIFRPIKPMLALKAESIKEALQEHRWKTAFEFKLDGLRAQIHKRGSEVRIFSRRLKDVTSSFPEIAELIAERISANEVVLEGEIIGIINGKPIPFQFLMRRVRRIEDFQYYRRKIPVDIYLFDVLYVDGKMLIDAPYIERRKILSSIANGLKLVPQLISSKLDEIEEFFEKAVRSGHEGLVAKKLDSNYTPGTRGKKWLKIKRTLEPLDCVIYAAEWGYGRRKKWLSDYYLSVWDEKNNKWAIIGKTFKGLSDKEFEEITRELLKNKIYERGRTVYVKPTIVVEIIYDEIQASPKYESGYALRFARINRIRWDKAPGDADTLEKVSRIYEKQFRYKAKISTLTQRKLG